MAFGNKVASDSRDSGGGEWIRYFKDDETQLRIMPAEAENKRGETVYGTAAWPQEYEHYDNGIRMSYPCTEDDDCVGCASPDKEVRKKGRKIYMFALDEDGSPRIYKMGPQLYKRLKMKEQRQLARKPKNLQPLSDRDYIILKSGKGMDTEYDAEAGEEAYEIEFPEGEEIPDLVESLTTSYEDAVAAYDGYVDADDEDDEDDDEPVRARSSKKTAAKKKTSTRRKAEPEDDEDEEEDEEEEAPAPRKRAAAKKSATRRKAPEPEPEDDEEEDDEDDEPEEKPAPRKRAAKKAAPKAVEPEDDDEDEEEESEGLGQSPSDEDFRLASTTELRAYLTKHKIEFPPRAPRKRLVEIAIDTPPY